MPWPSRGYRCAGSEGAFSRQAVSTGVSGVFVGVFPGVDEQRGEHDDEHATGEGRDPRARGCPVLGPPEEAGVGDEDEVVVAVKVDV